MHVILKPFIKLLIWVCLILGVAEIAGVDVEELLGNLIGGLEEGDGEGEEETTVVE